MAQRTPAAIMTNPGKMTPIKRRVLSLYDGRAFIGRIKIANTGEAHTFNQRGKLIGRFASLRSALDSFDQRCAMETAGEAAR
jgi:hypothetical protein